MSQNFGFLNPLSQNSVSLILAIQHTKKTNKTAKFQVSTTSHSKVTALLDMDQTPPIKFGILLKWPQNLIEMSKTCSN